MIAELLKPERIFVGLKGGLRERLEDLLRRRLRSRLLFVFHDALDIRGQNCLVNGN